jgi:VanZ family protein
VQIFYKITDDFFYKLFRLLPAGFYSGLIWFMSSRTVVVPVHGSDKTIHIIEYGIYGFLLTYGVFNIAKDFKIPVLQVLILGIITGFVDEVHQYFVPGRSCDVFDLLADSIGLVSGLFIFLLLHAVRKTKKAS